MKEITEYITGLELGGKSPNTIRAYSRDLNKLQKYFGLGAFDQLMALTSEDMMTFYVATGLKEESLKSVVRNLSAFFTWVKDTKGIEDHGFFHVRFGKSRYPKVTRKIKTVFSPEEQERIISAGWNKQVRFMVALMFHTALRAGEVVGIKLSDINGCEIKITGKGGDEACTYLNAKLCAMLNDYLADRKTDSGFLFYGVKGDGREDGSLSTKSVNNRFKSCVARAGINKHATAHTTRRSRITMIAIEHGKLAAQTVARHKNDTTTERYIFAGDTLTKKLLLDSGE